MRQALFDGMAQVVALMKSINETGTSSYVRYGSGPVLRLTADQIPSLLAGHRLEINNKLVKKGQSSTLKWSKFPAIALRMDVPETFENGYCHYTLNMAILHKTTKEWDYEKRKEEVFKPVLYPIYEHFMMAINDVGVFSWAGDLKRPPHDPIERPFWGVATQEANQKNVFTDPLDAIELVDFKISQRLK